MARPVLIVLVCLFTPLFDSDAQTASTGSLTPESLKAKLLQLPSHAADFHDANTDARMATDYVERILNGEKPENLRLVVEPAKYSFAARVIKRFHIAESQLAVGSEGLFRDQDVWQEYRRYFILGILVLAIQSFLVIALTVEGQRRKKLGLELKDLSRRLIDVQEGERRRIARELHDDLNQRVVLLGSHIEGLNSSNNGQPKAVRISELAHEAREISRGISYLSHQLHSSALEILGLEPALRGLARDVSLAYGLKVTFHSEGETSSVSPDVRLCLFRVAQESLSNAVKHSGATVIDVHLAVPENGKTIRLSIRDNGKGFNPNKLQTDSLGIISMRERLRLVDGELSLNSSPGQGTDVIALVKFWASGSRAAHA